MRYSKGISWFSDCRIPFVDGDTTSAGKRTCNIFETEYKSGGNGSPDYITDSRGRFPANILVSDDMLNDGIITKQSQRTYKPTDNSASLFGNSPQAHGTGIGDSGSSSRYYDIDKWFDNLIDG
jgi:hypothetical protein